MPSSERTVAICRISVSLVFGLALFGSFPRIAAAQECDTAKTITQKKAAASAAQTRASNAAAKLSALPPLATKPTAASAAAAKKASDDARDKWTLAKRDLETAKSGLGGKDSFALKQDLDNRKRELTEKQAEFNAKDVQAYLANAGKVGGLETDLQNGLNGIDPYNASEVLNNSDYRNFNPGNAKAIEKCIADKKITKGDAGLDYRSECVSDFGTRLLEANKFKGKDIDPLVKDLQANVVATNATIGTGGGKTNPWDEISRIAPKLVAAMDAQKAVLSTKFAELQKLDRGIKEIQNEIRRLQGEVETITNQLKPITEAEKKVVDTKKEYDTAAANLTKAEKGAQAVTEWEKAEAARKAAETEKTNADNNRTQAEADVTAAEGADRQFRQDAEKAFTDGTAEVARIRAQYRTDIATLSTPPDLTALAAFKQKAAKAFFSLQQRLGPFNCVAQKFRDRDKKLGEIISKLGGPGASIASDMEDPFKSLREIPNLDELFGDGPSSDDTPTDEVPGDIAKGTGKVKVIQYFVFLLTNASNGLYVGTEDSLKGTTSCGWIGGGVGCKPTDVIQYRPLAGPFETQAAAQMALCKGITETRFFPLGVGKKGKWSGQWYGLWNADVVDCPKQ